MSHTRTTGARRRSRVPRALAALVATAALAGAGAVSAAPARAAEEAEPLAGLVNPFIGTQDEGNTYPGAATPFGMVQFSPDNGHNVGYDYGRAEIRGFSLVHLSGVGCSLGGVQPMLATTGDPVSTDDARYALGYSHASEHASAGQYSVGLEAPGGTVTAELTATARTAVARYTFPSTEKATVLINTGQALNTVVDSAVSIVDARTVEARITTKGFCQDTPEVTFYTRTVFDRDVAAAGTWSGDAISADQTSSGAGRHGAWVQFDASDGDTTVEAQTALSYVDPAGAAANLEAESATYEQALARATVDWETRLHSIDIEGADAATRRVFYSSLYRSLLAPNIGSDVDGRYTGWDREIHREDDPDFTYYQNYSLWDTYRTQEQLVALLDPEAAADQALSLVRQGQQYGWLPRWGFATAETNIMTGDPGTVWLVSAWSQGLLQGHEEEAWEVLLHNADGVPPADSFANGRAGNVEYIRDGYVPQDPSTRKGPGDYDLDHGGSATLEYALADAALSTMGRALGHTADADRLAARGTSYRNIFDPSTGYFRARDRSGAFSGSEDPAQARGFHEATAVQYTWLVQQDPEDLMGLLGGTNATIDRLDRFFAFPDVVTDPEGTARQKWVTGTYDYYGNDRYNPNNEPDLHAPFMYLWAGEPWKTSDVLRAARTLFTDGPTGVTGNDDLGTMSAWYVLASIGLFPIVPGQDLWGLSTPAFEKVTIQRPDGKPLVIRSDGVSDEARYIQGVSMDGIDWGAGYIEDPDLDAVSEVDIAVGTAASNWATGEDAAPDPMIDADRTQQRLSVSASPSNLWVRPGGTLTVEASVLAQGAGTLSGTLTASGEGLATDPDQVQWSAASNGLPASTSTAVTVTAPEWAASGEHALTLTAATGDQESATEVPVQVGPASYLESSFDNTAIGDIGRANADFDGMGYFFDRTLLTGAGVPAGALLTIPETRLAYWIAAEGPDNLRMRGQTLQMPEALADSGQIALVGASNNGTYDGDVVLGLREESTGETSQTTAAISMPDWCSGANPGGGSRPLAITAQRGSRSGSDGAACGLYATAAIDVPEGQDLVSVTVPDNEKMHLFAIASDAPVWVHPELTATAPDSIGQGAPVAIEVSVDPAAPGSVRIYEGDRLLGEWSTRSREPAPAITDLAVGRHELTAVFVPDDRIAWSGAEAAPVTIEVTAAEPTEPAEPTGPAAPDRPGTPATAPPSADAVEGLSDTGADPALWLAALAVGALGLITTAGTRREATRATKGETR
ncbi:GH92 family glycosyl hydrolase [Schaalia naturae]|uniref:GH92 family glycosyl hydrolase n=1 Tax=Schaalia naturae TaxID=635203 RepID=A0ABW2SJF1_9ACTO